ncbi:MAG: hypothetical protein WCL50_12425 [Spirochaetota bacterium]
MDDTNADFHFLFARADFGTRGLVRPALTQVEAALVNGGFARIDRDEALVFKAELLIHLRSYAQVMEVLAGIHDPLQADAALLTIKAMIGLGHSEQALAALGSASRRHSGDPRFARLFFQSYRSQPTRGARDLAAYFLSRLASLSTSDPDLALLALPYMPSETERRKLITGFRASGGRGGVLEALEYGLLDPEEAVRQTFESATALDANTLDRLSLLAGGRGRDAIRLHLASFTGTITKDSDGDGIAEAETRYLTGVPVTWKGDEDQDGEVETSVIFTYGDPDNAQISRVGLTLSVDWAEYPYVATLSFSDAPNPDSLFAAAEKPGSLVSRRYLLVPGSLSFLPVVVMNFPDPESRFMILIGTGNSVPSEASAAACAAELVSQSGGETRRTRFSNGIAIDGEVEYSGGGQGKTEFRQGHPVLERVDQDGDGRFETILRFDPKSPPAKPAPVSMEIDLDADGYFEIQESLVPPLRRSWDYNADGVMDAVETRQPDGSVARQFSSHLDGVMDEALTVGKDGSIVSLRRSGKAVDLVQDLQPLLSWIGMKPFDLGSAMPLAEGIHVSQGRRYRLMKVGAAYLAESIP